jgi:2-dehydropantoate 2-reductase
MNIGVIGGGAIGLLFSAFLSKKHDVTIYTRTKEQAIMLQKKGIIVEGPSPFQIHVNKATSDRDYQEEILIISVKQYQLFPIIQLLKNLSGRTLIFVQNGMAHIELLKDLSMHNIILGSVEHGVLKKDHYLIEHTGIGRTIFCRFHANELTIINELNPHDPSFIVDVFDDWYSVLAKKLLANAIINPLTALYRVQNGELVFNPFFHRIAKKLFQEVWKVLELKNKSEHWDYVQNICKSTAKNRSSMLKDIENGQMTEIDAILGYIIAEAKKKHLSIPHVQFLFDSIKGIENQSEKGRPSQ